MSNIKLQLHQQQNPVADEVAALIAVVCPILQGMLFASKTAVVEQAGGLMELPLYMLPAFIGQVPGTMGYASNMRCMMRLLERSHRSLNASTTAIHDFAEC